MLFSSEAFEQLNLHVKEELSRLSLNEEDIGQILHEDPLAKKLLTNSKSIESPTVATATKKPKPILLTDSQPSLFALCEEKHRRLDQAVQISSEADCTLENLTQYLGTLPMSRNTTRNIVLDAVKEHRLTAGRRKEKRQLNRDKEDKHEAVTEKTVNPKLMMNAPKKMCARDRQLVPKDSCEAEGEESGL